jgi:hypothetical protein
MLKQFKTLGLAVVLPTLLSSMTAPSLAGGGNPNTLTVSERDAGWRLLFDGSTLQGWRGYHNEEIPKGWTVDHGTLNFSNGQGDIVTVDQFANFELTLQWKVSEGGNSGIFYLATLGLERIYLGAPEMQVLDDQHHADGKSPLTSAGANYALHPAPRGVVHPAGEWNQVLIRIKNEQVEHWLNGQKIVEYVIGSDDWKNRVAGSKFADWPDYGIARSGHIGLQDHGDPVWYRNIKIRVLD